VMLEVETVFLVFVVRQDVRAVFVAVIGTIVFDAVLLDG
jgi:hypothetical protein